MKERKEEEERRLAEERERITKELEEKRLKAFSRGFGRSRLKKTELLNSLQSGRINHFLNISGKVLA